VWDLSGERSLARLVRFAPPSAGASTASAIAPDGSLVAVSPAAGRVELVNARTRRTSAILRARTGDVDALEFSPDGKLLAAGGSGATAVWDLATKAVTRRFDASASIAFSADSSTLAVGSGSGGIELYDLRTGDARQALPTAAGVNDVDFSRSGHLLAAADLDGTAMVWALPSGHVVARLPGQVADFIARFSPNSRLLAVGDSTGSVVLWNVATGKPLGIPLAGHNGGVLGLSFNRSGNLLVTASGDGRLRLWDLTQHRLIGEPLPGTTDGSSVEFFPDGKHVFGMAGPGTGIIWSVDPAAWAARACAVANRNLTRSEWARYLPGVAYRAICRRP
jgi:WD40 repeat protein